MGPKFRCDCPITTALDVLGDKWMLVIVKLMLMEGRQTFKDFMESDEGIATQHSFRQTEVAGRIGDRDQIQTAEQQKDEPVPPRGKGLGLDPCYCGACYLER